MSRHNKNFLYKSKPTIHLNLSNHSLCWVECNSLHGKRHALKRKLLLSVRLLQSTGYISHLRCKVGILGQQWTLFITHSRLLLYLVFHTCSICFLDLLPYYTSIANGAGGVGIIEFLLFQCLYTSYGVNNKVIDVLYILMYCYTGILFAVLCKGWVSYTNLFAGNLQWCPWAISD